MLEKAFFLYYSMCRKERNITLYIEVDGVYYG